MLNTKEITASSSNGTNPIPQDIMEIIALYGDIRARVTSYRQAHPNLCEETPRTFLELEEAIDSGINCSTKLASVFLHEMAYSYPSVFRNPINGGLSHE